jgi:hypothetical protein
MVTGAGFRQTGDALTQDSNAALEATQRYSYGLIAALRRGTNRGTSRREAPAR